MSPRIKAQHVQSSVINGDYRGQLGPKLRDGAINVSVATALFTRYLRVIYAELYFFIFFVFAGGPGSVSYTHLTLPTKA